MRAGRGGGREGRSFWFTSLSTCLPVRLSASRALHGPAAETSTPTGFLTHCRRRGTRGTVSMLSCPGTSDMSTEGSTVSRQEV